MRLLQPNHPKPKSGGGIKQWDVTVKNVSNL